MKSTPSRNPAPAGGRRSRRLWFLVPLCLVLALAPYQVSRWTAEARRIAALGALAEVQGRCSRVCAERLLAGDDKRQPITAPALIERLGVHLLIHPAIKVTLHPERGRVRISVTEVDGVPVDLQGAFALPQG